ncbi:MAG TPA: hypothetical protein VK039_07890 [Brevibacterium sp.]|nr:hypothetical protein [Brevibacterium sp.]
MTTTITTTNIDRAEKALRQYGAWSGGTRETASEYARALRERGLNVRVTTNGRDTLLVVDP